MNTNNRTKTNKNAQMRKHGITASLALLATLALGNMAFAGYGYEVKINVHNGDKNPEAEVVVRHRACMHFHKFTQYPDIADHTKIGPGGKHTITFNSSAASNCDDKTGSFDVYIIFGHPMMDVKTSFTHTENGPAKIIQGESNIKSWNQPNKNLYIYDLRVHDFDVISNNAAMIVDFDNTGGEYQKSARQFLEQRNLTSVANTIITETYANASMSGSYGGFSGSAELGISNKVKKETKEEEERKKKYQNTDKHTYMVKKGEAKVTSILGSILKGTHQDASFFMPTGVASMAVMKNTDRQAVVGWYTLNSAIGAAWSLKTEPLQNSAVGGIVKITGLKER